MNSYKKRLPIGIENFEEIREIFVSQIQDWMQEVVRKDTTELDRFCEALKEGEPSVVESIFTSWLERTVSVRDTAVRKDLKENFYHGFLLGILWYQTEWKPFCPMALPVSANSAGRY